MIFKDSQLFVNEWLSKYKKESAKNRLKREILSSNLLRNLGSVDQNNPDNQRSLSYARGLDY